MNEKKRMKARGRKLATYVDKEKLQTSDECCVDVYFHMDVYTNI